MGLPQVSSTYLAEEVTTSLGTFVQSTPRNRIASIFNYELKLLAGEEELGKCMHIHMPSSEKTNVLELSKESPNSNMCKDGKSKTQKLKIDSTEQIGRLSVNAEQTMQIPTSRTVGFQIRASAPCVNGFRGNRYLPTGVSESNVKKRLLSPLNVTLLEDNFKSDYYHLHIGNEFYQRSSEAGDDTLHADKKVHIRNYNNIHSPLWSSSCFHQLVDSSCNDPNQILTSHGHSNCEIEEPVSFKHYRSFPAFNDLEDSTKMKLQTETILRPQNKASSPRFPLSPLGKKTCTDKKLGEHGDFDTMLSDVNLFTPDNILDMNEYWTSPASFPPRHAKLYGSVNRLPIRRSLVGSFEESLLSGRLPSEKVSLVGLISHIS